MHTAPESWLKYTTGGIRGLHSRARFEQDETRRDWRAISQIVIFSFGKRSGIPECFPTWNKPGRSQSRMPVLSRVREEDVPECSGWEISWIFSGKIRYLGNGIRERRPLDGITIEKLVDPGRNSKNSKLGYFSLWPDLLKTKDDFLEKLVKIELGKSQPCVLNVNFSQISKTSCRKNLFISFQKKVTKQNN